MPVFSKMCLRWILTVPGRMPILCAISRFFSPCSTRSTTCASRGVRLERSPWAARSGSRNRASSIHVAPPATARKHRRMVARSAVLRTTPCAPTWSIRRASASVMLGPQTIPPVCFAAPCKRLKHSKTAWMPKDLSRITTSGWVSRIISIPLNSDTSAPTRRRSSQTLSIARIPSMATGSVSQTATVLADVRQFILLRPPRNARRTVEKSSSQTSAQVDPHFSMGSRMQLSGFRYHDFLLELSAQNAAAYLETRGFGPPPTRIIELGGGVSNTVLLIETPARRFVLKQSLGKLRVEQDWFSDRGRIFRESGVLRGLAPLLPAGSLPEVLFEDRENCLFAMSAAPPEAQSWKSLLLAGQVDPEIAAVIGRMLGTLVYASWRSPDWEQAYGDQTVFDQLRLDPYYRSTALRHPELAPRFAALIEESGRRRVSLVHGDWSPKNFLVSPGSVMAIDFEVIHFGDPSFDAAFLLNHLLLKSFYRPQRRPHYREAAVQFWRALQQPDWFESATIEHLGGLLLARIDGKSPAEYIREPELKERIRHFARELIVHPPR